MRFDFLSDVSSAINELYRSANGSYFFSWADAIEKEFLEPFEFEDQELLDKFRERLHREYGPVGYTDQDVVFFLQFVTQYEGGDIMEMRDRGIEKIDGLYCFGKQCEQFATFMNLILEFINAGPEAQRSFFSNFKNE